MTTASIISGTPLVGLICMGLELSSAGDLGARSSSPRRLVVVELYTSQGCSSSR
jgi:hypothetical protein